MEHRSVSSAWKWIDALFRILWILLCIMAFNTVQVTAQSGSSTPQLVTASNDEMICGFTDQKLTRYIKIYNVGADGGDAYAQAILQYQTFSQDLSTGVCTPDEYTDLIGTFSGGPNGTLTFPTPNDVFVTTCQVRDGIDIECNFYQELLETSWKKIYTIENTEAFAAPVEATASTGAGCQPTVHGLNPAKPGDIISPGASYVDSVGKETEIIQERWFFNGQERTSTIWDGKEVSVELQWTCLDHSGFSKTFTIPAYQNGAAAPVTQPPADQSAEAVPETQSEPEKAVTPWGVAAIISGMIGIVGSASIGIGYALKNKPSTAPAPAVPPATPPIQYPSAAEPSGFQQMGAPTQYTPPDVGGDYYSPNALIQYTSPQVQLQPSAAPESPQTAELPSTQREELLNIRGQMQNEANNLKEKYYDKKERVEQLKRILKNNMLKFITEKGFDVQEWMVDGPADVVNKIIVDPIMEKAFQKHDTSQDGKIIVDMFNRIKEMENEMHALSNEFEYLQNEINKINQRLE